MFLDQPRPERPVTPLRRGVDGPRYSACARVGAVLRAVRVGGRAGLDGETCERMAVLGATATCGPPAPGRTRQRRNIWPK